MNVDNSGHGFPTGDRSTENAELPSKKRPWLKFYPSDWRSDPALRMCSLPARGMWAEMMCIMHEAEPYGHLLVNGHSVNEKQLASLAGGGLRETVNAITELESCGVFSRTAEGVIYSRRMVRDKEQADTDRTNGKGGGNPKLTNGVNPPDKPSCNRVDKAQTLEARDQKPERIERTNFQKLGSKAKSGRSPPKHGATGQGFTFVYVGTDEWTAHAADYREVRQSEPIPDAKYDGIGRWFKTKGEASG